MRTMASVWFLVIVLITINEVFGNICSNDLSTMNCDQCMRCGYHWCNTPGINQCRSIAEDDWCTFEKEELISYSDVNDDGADIKPMYAERSLAIKVPKKLKIHYTAHAPWTPKIEIENTTQTRNILIEAKETLCEGTQCVTQIEALATEDFCYDWGKVSESVYVKIHIGNYSEPVVMKYHVQCACECSLKNKVQSSPTCNYHGDYACGRCECHSEWKGENCSTPNCPEKRGDVQCMDSSRMDVNCFGNGLCGLCDTCICYTDREGSQYFDQDDYCADLCTVTSDCDFCLHNNTQGYCAGCIHDMKIIPYNQTSENDRDGLNRKVWMKCNLTMLDCPIEYMAMRNEDVEISVMVVKSCNDMEAGAVGVLGKSSAVPIILGALGAFAVIAAIAGVMIWKHMNAVPPVPLNDSQYQNIDAEDCQYQNPLYVSPTTSFKNPMFGKPQ